MDWNRRTWLLAALLMCTGLAVTQSWARDEGEAAGTSKAQPAAARDESTGLILLQPATTEMPKYEVMRLGFGLPPSPEALADVEPNVREGGETCATAVVIGALPFTDNGDTTDNINDYTSPNCNDDTAESRDVVYSYTPASNSIIKISMCLTEEAGAGHEDTRIWVYEGSCSPANEIACNDDAESGCVPEGQSGRQAEIAALPVTGGVTYFIIVDGWNGENGTYTINVRNLDNGACCSVVGGQVCQANTSVLDCLCLAQTFTESADCTAPDCVATPTGCGCPPGEVFGPGFHDGVVCASNGATFFLTSADDFFGTTMADAFWNVTQPIKFVQATWFYAFVAEQPGDPFLNGACDKADEFTVTFYEDACGEPGDIVAGPFDVTGIPEGTGFVFAGGGEIERMLLPLPVTVSLSTGWVGVGSKIDPNNPNCLGRAPVYADEDTAAGLTGDEKCWLLGTGAGLPALINGDFPMCLAAPANNGACCNDSTGTCTDDTAPANCPPPNRFVEGTLCADLDPPDFVPCGQGACCNIDGSCTVTNQAGCSGPNDTWKPGFTCEQANCPPANDECANATIGAGLPYTTTGRTNGATADDACEELGRVVWEAFTTSSCQDIIIDYCGTSPAFGATPLGMLMPSCCATNQALSACEVTTTARSGQCCIDDPPGYEGNFSLTFPRVPAGTWYYPVRGGPGANGDYVLNVEGADCAPGSCLTCTGGAEGEPTCTGANDTCQDADAIACGASVCGTSSSDDSDWYVVNAPAGILTWTVRADFPVDVAIFDGAIGCAANIEDLVLDTASACVCQDAVASACVTAGTYYLRVQPQSGANLACGTAYTATVSCGGSCTPVVGACCTNTGCTPNSTQLRCDAVNGHYNGDGTSCAPNTCPTLAANDECAGATVIPTVIPPAGISYTLRRSQLSANPTDGTPTCAAGSEHDASAWFVWTTPADTDGGIAEVAPISFNFCCSDGGSLGDSVAVAYRLNNTCAQIAADPVAAQLPDGANGSLPGCNDESTECGDQRAELCPNTLESTTTSPNRTYRFQVQFKDAGGPNEVDEFTMIVRPVSCAAITCPTPPACPTPVACPGGATQENEPVGNCAEDAVDDYNSGCNPLSRTPPDPEAFNGPALTCPPSGQTVSVCGTAGYFNTTGGSPTDRRRDTDWYELILTEETTVTWSVNSQTEGAQALVIDVNNCDNSIVLLSAADLNAAGEDPQNGCGAQTISGTLPAGRYAVFASFLDPAAGASNEAVLCPQPYVGTLSCERSTEILNTPVNACSSPPVINGAGHYSGLIGQTSQTPDGESTCDGALGSGFCDPPDNKDVYWTYVAPCDGRVSFEVRSGPAPMVLSSHTACPATCDNELPGGLGASCSDFGGGPGGGLPKITLDVMSGNSYVIRLAGDTAGPYELVVSDCTIACAGAGVPDATVTSAVSRRSNPRAGLTPPNTCDTNLIPARKSEPHQGGVQQVRIGFDVAPGGGGTGATLEQATCAAPAFVPYAGASVMSGVVAGNELVLSFAPPLENARSYRISLGPTITSIAGQTVELRGLIGDTNSDGFVNATDRSVVVSAWTGGGFSCPTDLNNDGATNATDRSVVVSAWTGGASTNCAP